MLTKTTSMVCVLILVAGAFTSQAGAVILPDPSLTLLIDVNTGDTWLKNTSAGLLSFNGYEIWSAGGLLDPAGWYSIADAVVAQPVDVMLTLGVGALSFGEMMATPDLLTEVSLSNNATLQMGSMWYIGQPAPQASLADLSFFYHTQTSGGDKYAGGIEIIPEPATLGLLAIGGLAMLRRRR